MNKKVLKFALIIIVVCIIICYLFNYFLNKYSIPVKSERLNNMIVYQGKSIMDKGDIIAEVESILNKHTNWDNLFISEKFKNKFRNRKGIIKEIEDYTNIWCSEDEDNDQKNVVVVYCDNKNNMLNKDESDHITVEYYFQYVLDANNEIDDLIFIKKQNTYTINGEKVKE